jgi:hypothetical protein
MDRCPGFLAAPTNVVLPRRWGTPRRALPDADCACFSVPPAVALFVRWRAFRRLWSVANCPCFSVLSFAAASPLPACCPETDPGAGSVSPACGLVIPCDASSARVVGHAAFSSSVTSSSSDIRDPCSRACANLAWRLLHAFFSLPIHSGDCAWPMSPSLDMVH